MSKYMNEPVSGSGADASRHRHYPTHTQMVSLFTVTYTQKEKSCRKFCCRVDASRDRQKYQSLSHSKKIVKCQLGYSGAIGEQTHLGTKDTAT